MHARDRRRWLWISAAGLLVALCAGTWGLMASAPAPDAGRPSPASPPPGVRAWVRPPPPAVAAPQPVPDPVELEPAYTETWTRVQDRADWVRGAVVTCLLPEGLHDGTAAAVDMDQGFGLKGRIDIMSRFYMPIEDGRIHMVVTEPEGEATLQILDEPEGPSAGPVNRVARIRWSNAQPGTTVGCDVAWESPMGELIIHIPGGGWPDDVDTDTDVPLDEVEPVEPPAYAVVHGCSFTIPAFRETMSVRSEPGPCVLRVDRRSSTFPLIVARGEPVSVYVVEGQSTEVTLRLPDEPPGWQAPEMTELATIADMAGFFGADAVADAVDEVMKNIATGKWSPDMLARILREATEQQAREQAEPELLAPDDEG